MVVLLGDKYQNGHEKRIKNKKISIHHHHHYHHYYPPPPTPKKKRKTLGKNNLPKGGRTYVIV